MHFSRHVRSLLVAITLLHQCRAFTSNLADVASHSPSNPPKRCYKDRAYNMMGYVCTNLNFKEIPQTLKTGVEVLDISFNRIRELTKESFSRYTSLKYLYLFENMIQWIEPGTFLQLQSLEALDLNNNALTSIPMEVFALPMLRNLYVYSNRLLDLEKDLELLEKPIRAPLKSLNLADSRLTRIPDFGVLPELWLLNISSNPLSDIHPQQLSVMCGLRSVDLNNTRMPVCMCQAVVTYLKNQSVQIKNGVFCDTSPESLSYCDELPVSNSTEEQRRHLECDAIKQHRLLGKEARVKWTMVAIGLTVFFVIFMGILYCFHRRSVRAMKKKAAQDELDDSEEVLEIEPENKEVLLDFKKDQKIV